MGLIKSSKAASKYGISENKVKKIANDQRLEYMKVKNGKKFSYLFDSDKFDMCLMVHIKENPAKKLTEAQKQVRRDNLKKARAAAVEKRVREKGLKAPSPKKKARA
jgi:hypothetical protein